VMTLFIEDFVNREQQLATLWKVIHQETPQRILLVLGEDGIGKTYLLDELQAECEEEGVACARVDFAELLDQSYMALVLSVWNQLGPAGFEHLAKTIADARGLGKWDVVGGGSGSAYSGNPHPIQSSNVGGGTIEGHVGDVGPGAQVAIGRDITINRADVINYNYVIQTVRQDEQQAQDLIQVLVTAAFQKCLIDLTTTREVVLLLDTWNRSVPSIRNWLRLNLLSWIASEQLPKASAVVAGLQVSDLQRPQRRIERMTLAGLPAEAVKIYWIEKRGLPPEELPHIIRLTGGHPSTVALLADRQAVPEPPSV